eukprot:2719658-Amphidinium_carterae.1
MLKKPGWCARSVRLSQLEEQTSGDRLEQSLPGGEPLNSSSVLFEDLGVLLACWGEQGCMKKQLKRQMRPSLAPMLYGSAWSSTG